MNKIGLVTVLYKSDDVLEGFFSSIAKQDYKDYILFLIDNSVNDKTDDLIIQLSEKFPSVTYRHIKSSGNIGVAAGNNDGIRLSLQENCSHVLLLNNDIEIVEDFLFSKMMKISATENMIVPKILYYDSKKIWMAGGYMDKFRALGVHYGYNKNDSEKYNVAKHVTYSPTCFMLIDKKVFDTVGVIDEKYFAYYDDTDFVLRAVREGYKIYYEPSLTILHKVGSSAGIASPFYVYYSNRNKIYFIRKNFKGFYRYFSLFYTFISRIAFYLKYDSEKRKKLVQGLKEGFRISIKK